MSKCIKTRDGSVWEIEKETKKEYLVRSRFRIWISKSLVVAKFDRPDRNK
jgi:hypothetical protein